MSDNPREEILTDMFMHFIENPHDGYILSIFSVLLQISGLKKSSKIQDFFISIIFKNRIAKNSKLKTLQP